MSTLSFIKNVDDYVVKKFNNTVGNILWFKEINKGLFEFNNNERLTPLSKADIDEISDFILNIEKKFRLIITSLFI
jgi:hypothetical protein